MKVAIRADANQVLGTGHIMRCLCLADELRGRGAETVFLSRDLPESLNNVLASKGHAVIALKGLASDAGRMQNVQPAESTWSAEAQLADSQIVLNEIGQVDCLIVDHYGLAQPWETSLRKKSGKIMIIDDLVNRQHDCDLLLNQNLGSRAQDYLGWLPPDCCILAGPSNALLRPEFKALRAGSISNRSVSKLQNILITMGGIDRENATGKVLAVLARSALPRTTVLSVVMGGQAPWLEQIRNQATHMPFETNVHVDTKNMGALMTQADFAIGAAGSTSWERCCLGLPSFTVIIAENQKSIASALHDAGAAFSLGTVSDEGFETFFSNELNKLMDTPSQLAKMSACALEVTDGRGARRVADQILAMA